MDSCARRCVMARWLGSRLRVCGRRRSAIQPRFAGVFQLESVIDRDMYIHTNSSIQCHSKKDHGTWWIETACIKINMKIYCKWIQRIQEHRKCGENKHYISENKCVSLEEGYWSGGGAYRDWEFIPKLGACERGLVCLTDCITDCLNEWMTP